MSPRKPLSLLSIAVVVFISAGSIQAAQDFASPLFAQRWQQDEQRVPDFWGPLADADAGQQEPYREAPGGQRLVQYFDKGRMELADGGVTNGLLATELISGDIQLGDTLFAHRSPPPIPIVGDPDNSGPTYAALQMAGGVRNPAPRRDRAAVSLAMTQDGIVSTRSALPWPASPATTFFTYDSATRHNVPASFADYRRDVGLATVGWAITEPFVAMAKVKGVMRAVMVQAFERRVLTYNPANPEQFRVEFGNIGQHYYQWRYGAPSSPSPPATDPVSPPGMPVPSGGTRVVTLADDGQTIVLFRGTSFVLALGGDFDWQVQIADEAIVGRDQRATAPPDSQGVYLATRPGQTTLTATGNPRCYSAVPRCLAPSRSFRVQIVVKQIPLPVPGAP